MPQREHKFNNFPLNLGSNLSTNDILGRNIKLIQKDQKNFRSHNSSISSQINDSQFLKNMKKKVVPKLS